MYITALNTRIGRYYEVGDCGCNDELSKTDSDRWSHGNEPDLIPGWCTTESQRGSLIFQTENCQFDEIRPEEGQRRESLSSSRKLLPRTIDHQMVYTICGNLADTTSQIWTIMTSRTLRRRLTAREERTGFLNVETLGRAQCYGAFCN